MTQEQMDKEFWIGVAFALVVIAANCTAYFSGWYS